MPAMRVSRFIGLMELLSMGVALVAGAERNDPRVLEGRVIGIQDGDTLTVLVDRTPTRIRISGIDSAERGQPWSQRAKRALSDRVFRKDVRIIEVTVDGYGRTVGEVYADDICVGCELVREGHAWVFRRYTDDPVLLELEAEARANRAGLWSLPEADHIPPWDWRDGERPSNRRNQRQESAAAFTCGSKRYCREMTSCDEARFYLEECGLARLDGDSDGVPSEKICRTR